jgi:oligopeptide transport system ATP-binding protein
MQICKEVPPSVTKVSDTHEAACWLHHENAPKVDIPVGMGGVLSGK